MIKLNGLPLNKLENNLKSLTQHLEDGQTLIKLTLLRQYLTIDFITLNQSLMQLDQIVKTILKKKQLQENPSVIAAYHLLNKKMISIGKSSLCNQSFLLIQLCRMLGQVLIGNEIILGNWFLNPSMGTLRQSLLHTEIDSVGSVLNCWNLSLKNVKSNSWFSIKENQIQKLPVQPNWQKIYSQLSTFSTVDKWEKEDIQKRYQKVLQEIIEKPKVLKPIVQKKKSKTNNNKIKPKTNKRKYTKKPKEKREKTILEKFNDKLKSEEETYRMKKIRIYPDAKQKHLFRKWLGTYRFIYNFTKDLIIKDKETRNFIVLRDNIVTESGNTFMANKKWTFETPKEIRSNSVRELLSNLSNLKQGGYLKYKSKKEKIQTIKLPKQSYKKNKIGIYIYPKLLGNLLTKTTKKERKYIPNEAACDIRITYSRPNLWHVLVPIPKKIKDLEKKPHNIVALDPNLRNLLTGAGIDGKTFKIGDNCYEKLKEHYLLLDKLKSKLSRLKKERSRLEYLRTKNILGLQEFKIKNLINDLHNKSIKYLTDNYDIILYPHLRIQKIVNKSKQFNRKAYSLGHYKLLQKIEGKCKILGKKLVKVSEAYTTKTCSVCGEINLKMGKEEIFKCPKCMKIMDRDINSARNILCKSLMDRQS